MFKLHILKSLHIVSIFSIYRLTSLSHACKSECVCVSLCLCVWTNISLCQSASTTLEGADQQEQRWVKYPMSCYFDLGSDRVRACLVGRRRRRRMTTCEMKGRWGRGREMWMLRGGGGTDERCLRCLRWRESVAMQIKRFEGESDRHVGDTLICTRSSCSNKMPLAPCKVFKTIFSHIIVIRLFG